MAYVDTAVAEAFRYGLNLGIYWRLDTSPDPLCLWMGVNDVPIGMDGIDADGTVYLGAGKMLDLPSLNVLLNGEADRVEFHLQGTYPGFLANLAADATPVKGKEVTLGIAQLDDRYQPTTSIIRVWTGYADFWSMGQTVSTDPAAGPTWTVSLSVGTGDTTRSRPRRVTWTAAMQRLLYPNDAGCDRVSRYVHNYVVSWPHFKSED